MTTLCQHTRQFWTLAVALVLAIALSTTAARAESPALLETQLPTCPIIEGCQDLWVIDARSAPACGDLAAGMAELRFYQARQFGILQYWKEHSQTEFLSAATPTLPTTYFFHGYGMGKTGAVISGERVADYIGERSPPFRLVIWIWPARHRLLASAETNLAEKTESANAQGYYLASLVRQMQPDSALTLAGHSFGARCVLQGLQAMAVGHVNGVPLPADQGFDRRMQAALLAPAVASSAMSPSGEFFLATTQVDRTLITVNEDDRSLLLMARLTGDSNILGLTGPADTPADSHIYLLDANPYLGRHHRVSEFLWSEPVVNSLTPFLIKED